MNTTVPANTTSVAPKAQVKSVHQHTQDVQSEPITPTHEPPDNNKGNSNVSALCVPNPKVQNLWKKLKPRNQGGHPDHINPACTA